MLTSANIQNIYKLSPMQEGMYFHFLLDPSSSAYLEQMSYTIQGNVAIPQVSDSLNELFKRHHVLRTVFNHEKKDQALQIVLKERAPGFYFEDLRKLPVADKQAYVQTYKAADKTRTFDLTKDVLMRVSVLQLEDDLFEFVWTFHHILMDGWCLGILTAEFFELYNSSLKNIAAKLPPVIPYNAYIQWLDKQDKTAAANYWKTYIEGYTEAAQVPPIQPSGKTGTYQNQCLTLALSKDQTQQIQALATQQNVTLNALLQTTWGVLLSIYNATSDVVYGTVVSGRPAAIEGVESIVGLFINTVPVRVQYQSETSFVELLESVHAAFMQAEPHHYFPLADIQADSALKQHLLNHLLVFENFPISDMLTDSSAQDTNHLRIVDVNVFEQTNYDFNLVIVPGAALQLKFIYNDRLYNPADMQRIFTHLQILLNQVCTQPTIPVRKINLLSEEEKQQILVDFNATTQAYPANQTIVELFEAQARINPDQLAVACGEETLTYAQLNARANQLAHYLRTTEDTQPNDCIGLLADRSIEMLVGIWGILKAGAAYVPVDPTLPEQRIHFMLDNSSVRLLITDQLHWAQTIDLEGYPVFSLTENAATLQKCSAENPEPVNCPTDLLYVMYTSGSTGQPKGVMIEHRSVVKLVKNTNYTDLNTSHKVLQLSNFMFDGSTFDIFGALLNGASLYLIPKHVLLSNESLVGYIESCGINVMFITTALFNNLTELSPNTISRFEKIYFGGEEASLKHIRKALAHRQNPDSIVHVYGPTEATTFSTFYVIESLPETQTYVPIGQPLANTSAYILNENMAPVPVGVAGELYIGGESLAKGYLKRPELTAEKFVKNPFITPEKAPTGRNPSAQDEALWNADAPRLYRTGDIARWTPDGNIVFMGRRDHQVKIRGYRIELGEIENTLRSYAPIEDVLVLAKTTSDGSKQLVAYYVSKQECSLQDLRSHFASLLPDYMIPSWFVWMEKFPLNTSSKVDRKALPDPTQTTENRAITYVAPRNATEEKLADIWQNVLDSHAPIGVQDNFFEIGGHSLKATRIVSRLYKEFQKKIDLKAFFAHPTIESLAQLLAQETETAYEAIPVIPAQLSYEVSHAQKRFWILDQFKENQIAYNLPGAYLLEGTVQTDKLKKVLEFIWKRHESLRTTLASAGGQLQQYVHEADTLPLPFTILDLTHLPDAEDFVRQIAYEEAHTAFDLAKGPLVHLKLFQLKPQKSVLLLNMHHIISDGWSTEVFIKELLLLYHSPEAFETLHPPLNIQHKDYVAWQNQQLTQDTQSRHKEYWKQTFSGDIPVLNLPADFPRPAVKTSNGDRLSLTLSLELFETLKTYSRQQEVSPFMVVLAAFKALFYNYSSQQDIILGTPISGRNHPDLENQIGLFINLLAVRTQFNGAESFEELLRKVRQNTLSAYEHQTYPFDSLVDNLNLARDLSRAPLFDVMVMYFNSDLDTLKTTQPNGLSVQEFDVSWKVSKFDLTFNFFETVSGIQVSLEYNTDLFLSESVQRLWNHFTNLLQAVLTNSQLSLDAIPYLSEAETHHFLTTCNQTQAAYPADRTIDEWFEIQAAQTPNAVALVYEGKTYTYAQLNTKANQLAQYLRNHYTIRPNDRIGILANRSEWMLIAMLGVLKAGGTYLPVDPHFPQSRIDYMLEDSGIELLLVTEEYANRASKNLLSLENEALYQGDGQNLPRLHTSRNGMYMLYTSGSTGKPKGVEIRHQSVVNFLTSMQQQPGITAQDRLLAVTTYSFDISVLELFLPLTVGATIILVGQESQQDPYILQEIIRQENPTFMQATPSLWTMLLQTGWKGSKDLKILTGGETLSKELARELLACTKEVWNMYGPTETTIWSLLKRISPTDTTITIGKPILNTEVYILNAKQKPVATGVAGELYIGGVGLANGYHNRPDLTAEKFVKNPFAPNKHLYRTGDLARWTANGELEFLGRLDHQVKIRGHRIELGEIEEVLLQYEGLTHAVVVAHKEVSGSYELAGYFAAASDIDIQVLRQSLKRKLPDYMVPSYLRQLEALPLTPNGKIDRKALPNPDPTARVAVAEYTAPETDLEHQLAAIWEEELNLQTVSVTGNFFDMGGHSLKAVRVLTCIQEQTGENIVLRDIFNYPTIRQLATFISHGTENRSLLISLSQDTTQEPVFCVPPLIGSSMLFKPLASYFEGQHSFYGLQCRGFDFAAPFDTSIEAVAQSFVAEMTRTQPDKTHFVILAYSMGVTIAYEMARQLDQKGIQAQLFLLDSGVHNTYNPTASQEAINRDFDFMVGTELGHLIQLSDAERIKKLMAQNYANLLNYTIDGTTQADIVALEAEGNTDRTHMEDWEAHTSGQFIHTFISGNHLELLLAKHLPALADTLKDKGFVHKKSVR